MSSPYLSDKSLLSAWVTQALQCYKVRDFVGAELLYRQVLSVNPAHADALHLYGCLCDEIGRSEEAIQLVTKATQINPLAYPYFYNLANIVARKGRNEEAIRAYQVAIRLNPDYAEAYLNLALTLKSAGHMPEAIASYRRAVLLKPTWAQAHYHLGNAYSLVHQLHHAQISLREALHLDPANAKAHTNLGSVLMKMGQLPEAISEFRAGIKLDPHDAHNHSNLILAASYSSDNPAAMREECQRWHDAHGRRNVGTKCAHGNIKNPARRLRVGYVSADFRQHAAAYWIEPLLAGHQHGTLDIYCYCNSHQSDHVTAKLKKYAFAWVPCVGLDDAALAARIRQDQIDILVDLSGHTSGNRLLVFALQPAPIQVSWFGFPVSTGLSTINYRFTDEWQDPTGLSEQYYSEELIRLPRFYAAFRPDERAAPIGTCPAERNGHITFASLNSLSKLSPSILEIWADLLLHLPNSRLLFQADGLDNAEVRKPVTAVFVARGVSASRLTFRGWTSLEDYLRVGNEVDIALDSYPFNGGVTSCHTLWMGLPLVSLSGKSAASRVGRGILSQLGLTDWIAEAPDQYRAIAVQLAKDPVVLAHLRLTLRSRMQAAGLLDGDALAQRVEGQYKSIWAQWCELPSRIGPPT